MQGLVCNVYLCLSTTHSAVKHSTLAIKLIIPACSAYNHLQQISKNQEKYVVYIYIYIYIIHTWKTCYRITVNLLHSMQYVVMSTKHHWWLGVCFHAPTKQICMAFMIKWQQAAVSPIQHQIVFFNFPGVISFVMPVGKPLSRWSSKDCLVLRVIHSNSLSFSQDCEIVTCER